MEHFEQIILLRDIEENLGHLTCGETLKDQVLKMRRELGKKGDLPDGLK